MMKYYKKIVFNIFAFFASINVIIAYNFHEDQYFLGDKCISIRHSLSDNGICTPIEDCPEVLAQMIMHDLNYTMCEYEGFSQVVCCPMKQSLKLDNTNNRLMLSEIADCIVNNSTGETGVIKFKSECNDFDETSTEPSNICDYEICADLICCPTKLSTRKKQVCSNVDIPADMITLRLHLNQACVVKDTNLTGRYQKKCDYAERNPHMEEKLRNVCNDNACNGWYCCPIEDPYDKYYCENKMPLPNVKIVGPTCIDSRTGQTGRCRSMEDCYGFTADQIEKCGKYCCLDYYCCPDPIQNIFSQPLHVQQCWEYSQSVNKHELEVQLNFFQNRTACGDEILPVGGVVVEPGEYPHMAALGYELNGDVNWKCSGSLISDEYILTAAHCLVNNTSEGVLKVVRLGVIDLYNDIETLDCPEDFPVLRTIPHPDYNPRFSYNDIGLIQLNGSVEFNFHIRPICLPSTSIFPARFESMGWGATGPGENPSTKLIKVQQDFYSHEKCQQYYLHNRSKRLNRGVFNDTQMCAGSIHDIQGTCVGDSGGPLLANHPKMNRVFEIYGIVSTGTICGFINSPGIYTQVFPFKAWIEEIVFT